MHFSHHTITTNHASSPPHFTTASTNHHTEPYIAIITTLSIPSPPPLPVPSPLATMHHCYSTIHHSPPSLPSPAPPQPQYSVHSNLAARLLLSPLLSPQESHVYSPTQVDAGRGYVLPIVAETPPPLLLPQLLISRLQLLSLLPQTSPLLSVPGLLFPPQAPVRGSV